MTLCAQEFMTQHGFNSIEDFRGASLPYFTTHTELVRSCNTSKLAKPCCMSRKWNSCAQLLSSGILCLSRWRLASASSRVSREGETMKQRSHLAPGRCLTRVGALCGWGQVRMQKEAISAKKRARVGLSGDSDWSGDGFVKEAESMVAN